MYARNRFDEDDVNPSILFPQRADFNQNARLMHQTRSRAQALADPALERAIQQEATTPQEAAELRRVVEEYGSRQRVRPQDIRRQGRACHQRHGLGLPGVRALCISPLLRTFLS